MRAIDVLLIVWGVVTTVLAVLLIYRYALSLHEDDQIFLDDAESHLAAEQHELMTRIDRLRPYVNILGASSGLLVLVLAGLWVWHGLYGGL